MCNLLIQVIITDLGEIGENAIIVFEENVGVGAEEIVANQEYVAYTGDSDDVIQVHCTFKAYLVFLNQIQLYFFSSIGSWAVGRWHKVRSRSWYPV